MRSPTGTTIIWIFLILTACLLLFSESRAQNTDLARLEDEIRRNAELIKQAEHLVKETNSIKARASLQAAIHLHNESMHLLTVQNRPLRAASAVKKAREAVLRAIALAKREAKAEENAKRAIERARIYLDQAKTLLKNTEGQETHPAKKIIDGAQVQMYRSIDNMREHLFATALQLANSSKSLSIQAIKLLGKDQVNSTIADRELNKTDRLLERISSSEDLTGHPEAERMYLEARDLQARAHELIQNGRPQPALEMTQRAKSMAMNIIKILTASPNAENVDRAIQLTEGLLEQAHEMIIRHSAEKASKKLEKARELQDRAKSLASTGDFNRALRFTLRARELVQNAIVSLDKPLDATEVEATLRATDALIEKLKADLDRSEDRTDNEIVARILSHQESAWFEFHRGKLKAALTRTKLARNLTRRILDRIDAEKI